MTKRIIGWLLLLATLAAMAFAVLQRGTYASFFAQNPLLQFAPHEHQGDPDPYTEIEADSFPEAAASSMDGDGIPSVDADRVAR